jgi:hypothetical protein
MSLQFGGQQSTIRGTIPRFTALFYALRENDTKQPTSAGEGGNRNEGENGIAIRIANRIS